MERYYDGDQEALFKAAHVINPYVKPKREAKVTTESRSRPVFIYTKIVCQRPSHTSSGRAFRQHHPKCAFVCEVFSSFRLLSLER